MASSLNKITVFCQLGLPGSKDNYTADWSHERGAKLQFESALTGKEAAEEAFIITNAPEEVLTDAQKETVKAFRGPSLSVGDLVQIEEAGGKILHCLCAGNGWEEKEVKKALPPHDFATGKLRQDLAHPNENLKNLVAQYEARLAAGKTIHLHEELLKGAGYREVHLAFHQLTQARKAKGISPYATHIDRTPVNTETKKVTLSPLTKEKSKAKPVEEMTME